MELMLSWREGGKFHILCFRVYYLVEPATSSRQHQANLYIFTRRFLHLPYLKDLFSLSQASCPGSHRVPLLTPSLSDCCKKKKPI